MLENTQSQFIRVGDINLHVVTAGPEDGKPVILLHGFPEFWYGWRNQIPFLAQQGYRVIVPDQRGYNLSDKPESIEGYRISTLATDVKNLIEVLGYEKVYLVGHDWGAAVSWMVATIYPEYLDKMVILNVPYPRILRKHFFSGNIRQLLKSWYMFFFQIPTLPEFILSAGNFRALVSVIRNSSLPHTFSDEDIEQYKVAWGQAHAVRSMVHWYRAMFQASSSSSRNKHPRKPLRIVTPTLMLWGEKDIAIGKELAQPSIDLCDEGKLIFLPDATHWVQHDEVNAVNHHIHKFLTNENPS